MTPFASGPVFRAELVQGGGATTGFVVPTGLPVEAVTSATVNGLRLPASISWRDGRPWLSVDCAAADVVRGQVVEVELDLPIRATPA
ncbi:hypothetical protein ACWKSP_01865 [Micromonosporaceae bacterium Da 78-11]